MLPLARGGRAPRFLSALTILLALALMTAMAACGNDDDTTPAGTSGSGDTAGTETETQAPAADNAAETADAAFPVSVTDGSGETIDFDEAPERIISYSPAATEVLFALGAGDRVVATDEYSNYPAEAQELPELSYSDPPPEPALGHDPDLVIMSSWHEGQLEQFRELDMRVVFLPAPEDLDGVLDHIQLLGEVTGTQSEAEDIVAGMEERIAEIESQVGDVDESPRVFYELSPSGHTVAPGSFIGEMLEILGTDNIASDATSQFPELSSEVIIERDPEVILLATHGEHGGQSLETLRERPGWDEIAAIQDERVYPVDPDIFSRPGPRVVDALEELVDLLHGGDAE